MKINRGKGIGVSQSLVFTNETGEELVLMDDISMIRVTTDNTDFDEIIEGYFGFVDDNNICVGDEKIPIEYIEEIEFV